MYDTASDQVILSRAVTLCYFQLRVKVSALFYELPSCRAGSQCFSLILLKNCST
jgi:hypothetical protein